MLYPYSYKRKQTLKNIITHLQNENVIANWSLQIKTNFRKQLWTYKTNFKKKTNYGFGANMKFKSKTNYGFGKGLTNFSNAFET